MTSHPPHPSINVTVTSQYMGEQSAPAEDRYLFAYTVLIHNTGTTAATLKTRHWIITNADGEAQEVRGDGVVGEQPHLEPGESFEYTSAAVLDTPVGSMHGTYQMVADDGVEFDAIIPAFGLSVPNVLH